MLSIIENLISCMLQLHGRPGLDSVQVIIGHEAS